MALARDEVVTGALLLLDKIGLDDFTMRRLAQALGVRAGAIYWHFTDRQELEDAMVDAAMGGILTQPLTGKWDQQVGELMRRMAAALLAHRDGARLALRALKPGPNGLLVTEVLLQILQKSKRPKHESLWAASVLGYYVIGFVIDMQATESAKARGAVAAARELFKKLDKKRYPELAAIGKRALADLVTGRESRDRFEFGLAMVLRGLKAKR